MIEKILKEAKRIGLQKVGLTGGEPFLERDRLIEIGSFVYSNLNLPIHIHSNGTVLSTQDAEWIKKLDAEITLPMYGNTSELHDNITGRKGSFVSTVRACRSLLDVNAKLCVFIVPMKKNIHAIRSMIEFLSKEGIQKARILTLSPTGRAKLQFEKLELDANDNKALSQELIAINKEININLSMGFCTSQDLKGIKILEGHEECFAGENRIHIDTSGNVFPCTASSGRLIFSAGNLKMEENNLTSIWRDSPLLQFFRRFHNDPPKKCVNCLRYPQCMSGCRLKMSYKFGDVTIPDPTCGGPYS
jgi:radical SAM protein with 4Fe4S-binding SPASM domain